MSDDYPEPTYRATCEHCGREDELDGPPYGPYFCSYECSKKGVKISAS